MAYRVIARTETLEVPRGGEDLFTFRDTRQITVIRYYAVTNGTHDFPVVVKAPGISEMLFPSLRMAWVAFESECSAVQLEYGGNKYVRELLVEMGYKADAS